MSYPKFLHITLENGSLKVEGETGEIAGSKLIEDVTAFDVAIVCLHDPDRRLETSLRRTSGDKVIEPWKCRPVPNEIEGFSPFEVGEIVVLVGSATHENPGLTSPFLWHGFHKIQSPNDPADGDVTLVLAA